MVEEVGSELELAKAEIKRLNKVIDDLREERGRRKLKKLKDALALCHRSPHFRFFYDALQINGGRMETLYQEYCTLCKAENIKPVKKVSMHTYTRALVKEGKIIQLEGGRYIIVKDQVRVIEDRSRR